MAYRTEIAERRVEPLSLLVEPLDVVEEVGSCLGVGVIRTMMHPLTLQSAEEALHRSVVVPGANAIHSNAPPQLKTPYRAPRANAYCERFIGSLRRECLDHFIILNERHLYRIVKEYESYFNNARPHQGIEQRIPCQPGPTESPPVNGKLASRPMLNGLHHTYSWVATQSVGHNQAQRPIYH